MLQRLGRKLGKLTAGWHFVIPWIDAPRTYSWRYYKASTSGRLELINFTGRKKISTKTESMDFPKQDVISRDNARITLDAILNYRIADPVTMIYSTQNLPYMLSNPSIPRITPSIVISRTEAFVKYDRTNARFARWATAGCRFVSRCFSNCSVAPTISFAAAPLHASAGSERCAASLRATSALKQALSGRLQACRDRHVTLVRAHHGRHRRFFLRRLGQCAQLQ